MAGSSDDARTDALLAKLDGLVNTEDIGALDPADLRAVFDESQATIRRFDVDTEYVARRDADVVRLRAELVATQNSLELAHQAVERLDAELDRHRVAGDELADALGRMKPGRDQPTVAAMAALDGWWSVRGDAPAVGGDAG